MSATEVIEQIKSLPPEEQRKVFAFVRNQRVGVGPGEAAEDVSKAFKQIADEVFDKNEELFRKLAQ